MTILVVDHGHSTVCGIHDLGVRIADRLGAVHADCSTWAHYQWLCQSHQPDAVIVNYRRDLMPWWSRTWEIPELAVLHNYSPDTVGARAADLLTAGFDHVLVLDPTVTPTDPRVHAVGRPILDTVEHARQPGPPMIGSFGFAFPHKGFDQVAAEINDQLGQATFALHMPEAFFNGVNGAELYTEGILKACHAAITKPAIDLWYTNDHIDGPDLVNRLAQNDVNCLFYVPGQPDAGLSSALDYLIAARRPIMTSDCAMFRHADGYAATWPHHRLGDVLDNYHAWQARADMLYEQTVNGFADDMADILDSL